MRRIGVTGPSREASLSVAAAAALLVLSLPANMGIIMFKLPYYGERAPSGGARALAEDLYRMFSAMFNFVMENVP